MLAIFLSFNLLSRRKTAITLIGTLLRFLKEFTFLLLKTKESRKYIHFELVLLNKKCSLHEIHGLEWFLFLGAKLMKWNI